ncbi:MAG: molybdenum cofactor biosynthesis protein MoaB [Chloroflexaceae bacterium]|nr:molybdenum cofactor biosynthesis protein MoaB [Chloroflexaceae bacterium]
MGYQNHQEQAHQAMPPTLRCGVLTMSDTRTMEQDSSGHTIQTALHQNGHHVVRYELIPDDPVQIAEQVHRYIEAGCQVIITNGGTGIAQRDTTIDVIEQLLEKRLPGFGELFRMLSYVEIGAGAMLSRATAGVYQGVLIFCLPGSSGAVRLALEKLILPELTHLVWETVRSEGTG